MSLFGIALMSREVIPGRAVRISVRNHAGQTRSRKIPDVRAVVRVIVSIIYIFIDIYRDRKTVA